MQPVDLDRIRSQYRGSRYADLVAHHLRRQAQQERVAGVFGTAEWLPAPLRPTMEQFIDRWNTRAYKREFWDRSAADVMDEIISDARALAESHGLEPDDDTLFNIFNIVTMSFAYSAQDQPRMQEFMNINVERGFPIVSTFALLYPAVALAYALMMGMPFVVAIGFGVAQLSYVLAVAGMFGSFLVLGLRTRKSIWGTAIVLFLLGVVLSNAG